MSKQYSDENGDDRKCVAPVNAPPVSGPVLDERMQADGSVPGSKQTSPFLPNPATP